MVNGEIIRVFGVAIIANSFITEEIQARKHKKKRINKKWLKRYGTKTVPSNRVYLVGCGVFGENTIIAHPKMVERILNDTRRKG